MATRTVLPSRRNSFQVSTTSRIHEDENGRRYRAYPVEYNVPILFDTGCADTTEALFGGTEAIGLDPERLVLTHADPGHVGGFDAVIDYIGGFEAIHTTGHSADYPSLVNEARGVLVAGNAVCGADLRGFPAWYLLPHAAVYAEDLTRAEPSLDPGRLQV